MNLVEALSKSLQSNPKKVKINKSIYKIKDDLEKKRIQEIKKENKKAYFEYLDRKKRVSENFKKEQQNKKSNKKVNKNKKEVVVPHPAISTTRIYFYVRKEKEMNIETGLLMYVKRKYHYKSDPDISQTSLLGEVFNKCYEITLNVETQYINQFNVRHFYNVDDDGVELINNVVRDIQVFMTPEQVEQFQMIGGSKNIEGFYIKSSVAIQQVQGGYIWNKTALKEDSTNLTINNKYIKYIANLEAKSFKDLLVLEYNNYLKTNFRPNSCVLTVLINKFYDRFNTIKSDGKRAYKELTYEYLAELLEIDLKPSDNSCDLQTVIDKFINRFKFAGLFVYNCYMQLLYKSVPETNNPIILKVMMKDNHIYQLNDNLKSLEQRVNYEDDERDSLKVNNKYHIKDTKPKTEEEIIKNKEIFIESQEDIIINITKEMKLNDKLESLKIITMCDLTSLLFEILSSGYTPNISYSNRLNKITLLIKKTVINIIRANQSADYGLCVEFSNLDEYKSYTKANEIFNSSIIKKEYLSDIHPQVSEIDEQYKISPLTGTFIESKSVLKGVDENRAYTQCLMSIDEIPIFNYFDVYKTYDSHPIENLTYYLVEVLEDNKRASIIFNGKYSRVYGFVLKQIDIKYKILYYRRPLKTEEVNFKSVVDELYNTPIQDNYKKSIANITIGLLEKKQNKAELTKIFKNQNEAQEYSIKYNGVLYTIENETNEAFEEVNDEFGEGIVLKPILSEIKKEQIYIVILNKKEKLINGFTPIKDMVYLLQRLKTLKNFDKLSKHPNIKIHGIKTDSILYSGSDSVIKQEFNIKSGIGNYKLEKNKYLVDKMIQLEENELIKINTYENVKPNFFKNERDIKETNKYIQENNNILVIGDYAGVGKSTLCKNFDKESLFVCPYNKLCQVLRTEGYKSITYSKMFGLYGDDQEKVNTKGYNLEGIETIVFDEIFLYEPKRLKRIAELMKRYPNKKFLATGDNNQRDPIAFKNPEYLKSCMNILFPNQTLLKDIKRLSNEEDKKKMRDLKIDILEGKLSVEEICKKYNIATINKISNVKTLKNICYFNFRCNIVNKNIHFGVLNKKTEFEVGNEIICRAYQKYKNITLNTNYTYKIMKIDKAYTTIKDENENESYIIPNGIINTYFKLPYALTCDSVQGLSFDENEKITIFDSNTPYVDRKYLYTAITRARNLKDIQIFIHSENENKNLMESKFKLYFRLKAQNYKNQDKKANRPINETIEYVNEEWISTKLDECKGVCPQCKKFMELYLDGNSEVVSNITVDRTNSNLPHYKNNCVLMCGSCNKSKGARF